MQEELDILHLIMNLIHVMKDKKFYVQACAGVVADSKPEKEYVETVNKAKALMKAID